MALVSLCAFALVAGAAAGSTEPVALLTGTALHRELGAGGTHTYSLEAMPGDYLEVEALQQGIDVVLVLAGEDGTTLLEVDSPNGTQGRELLRAVVGDRPATGLLVRAGAEAGRYSIHWRAHRQATAEDRLRALADGRLRAGRAAVPGDREAVEGAISALAEARDAYRRLGEAEGEAEALFHGSVALRRLGRYEEALGRAQAAVSLNHPDPLFRARLLNGLAMVQRRLGQDEDALATYREALGLWREQGSALGEATTLNNLAVVQERLGHDAEALGLYRAALGLWTELEQPTRRVSTLINLGHLHERRRELRLALEHLQEAVRGARAAENPPLLAQALDHLAGAHEVVGDWDAAIATFHESLALRRKLGIDRETAHTLNNLGWAYLRTGEAKDSLPFFGEALRLSPATGDLRHRATYLENLGRAQGAAGQREDAQANLNRSLKLSLQGGDELGAGRQREALGWVLLASGATDSQQLETARQHFLDATEAGRRLGERVLEASARNGLAALHRRAGRLLAALEETETALGLVETLRSDIVPGRHGHGEMGSGEPRASYLALKRPVYEARIDLLMELHGRQPEAGWAAKALEASERAKARSLLEGLGGARLAPLPLSLEEIRRQVLGDDTLLLEIGLGEERSFLWLVTQEVFEAHELPSRREIEDLGRRLAESLAQPPSRDRRGRLAQHRLASQLAELVLGPVASRLGDRRLLVAGEGILLYLPVGALPDPRSKSGEPLLARNEVISAPSASVLAALRREATKRPAPTRTLAVLADPVFAGDGRLPSSSLPPGSTSGPGPVESSVRGLRFSRLPASAVEGQALAALVPQDQRLVALGFEASRELALGGALGDYRYLHFATHGIIDSRSPQLSALVLSQWDPDGRPVDGLLRLKDVYALQLRAELVVLSACRTALGKEIRGEGLLGLVRGFMAAGAPRVVASLWQVDDRATAALMERFYRGLLQEGLPAASALRQAQLALWRGNAGQGWRAPYYWAAFQIYGEWR